VTLDPEIHDERLLIANVAGRGTSVLTACSHAGVVNVGVEARRLQPSQPIDLLLGGYHLAGATVEDRIEPTVRDLRAIVVPRIVAPGHCTGWRAAAALADAFSPTGYAPSVFGTRYCSAPRRSRGLRDDGRVARAAQSDGDLYSST
jgi:7,8-dihydropterin-6-yl-methyl-4-(beta-D-ribofuranosyl)aminobenzene 5'-phosphate synthase